MSEGNGPIEGNIATIRSADPLADVVTRGRVIATKEYEPDASPWGGRWSALIRDPSGEIPVFGFGEPPPIGAWIVVRGHVGGFVQEALEDQAFVEQVVAERGWIDSAEIGVWEWRVVEAPEAEEKD
jgi:hypothetical protein